MQRSVENKFSSGNGVPSLVATKQDKKTVRRETISRFIKGGTSGLISAFLLQPLQVVKTTMQVSPVSHTDAQLK